jgi:hypothetical protein
LPHFAQTSQGNVIYFPKAGTYQNIEEFLTAKANKANKDVGSSSFFPLLFRLIRLRGGSFLQDLYDFEKILMAKKVNDVALQNRRRRRAGVSAGTHDADKFPPEGNGPPHEMNG